MATCMTTMTSDLYSHGRSDPEYYLPNHTRVEAELNLLPTVPLRGLGIFSCSAFYPAATHLYSEDGMPFLRCIDIVDFPLISPDQPFARIPQDFVTVHSSIRTLYPGDIVISKVGTPCYASLLAEEMPTAAMTRTVLGMSGIREDLVNPYYLIAFLRSRYGFDQLMRERELTIQYQLTLDRTRKVRVYLPNRPVQDEIGNIIQAYYQSLRDGLEAYESAQHLLECELGLDKLSFQKPVGYTARFSELEQLRRLDPEHFYPAFHDLVAHLPDHLKLVPLATQLSFCQRGKQPLYSDHGLPVVNSKHVQPNRVVLEGNRTALTNPIAELQIRYGDTLMNGTGRGTLGRAAPYLIDRQAIPDNHVTILRSTTLDPAYLSFYLNSQAGQLQVEIHQRGTSGQLELYPFDIRKFLVWAAPESFQKEIRKLYDQAAASERRSKELLDQAKTRVEQLIEEAVRS